MAGQNFDNQELTYVGTGWGAEGLYVNTKAANTSVDGCGPRFLIAPDHPMLKEMTALLLVAFTTGYRVSLYVDGCLGSNMNLKAVAIVK